ncbi:MAG: FtsW/RodA/SpoVE family cell cycle protein, partial [Cytophagaceae bacterium]|nr:FtsW/RodA/SpoVE family cell cycle protein [Cytophagaceae bacterium]
IGRVPMKYLLILALSGVLVGAVALSVGQRGRTALNRLMVFFNPKQTELHEKLPYQAEQSYIAIWNGGLLGKGPGNSAQKNFLPHPYSDFIYAIIIEEYGFIGGLFILFLYLALLYRGMKVAANSDRAFGGLLSAGLAFGLVIQALINMGVAVGVGPITGQPLPLLSMGGTSLLFTGLSLGIILSVSRGDITEEVEVNNE